MIGKPTRETKIMNKLHILATEHEGQLPVVHLITSDKQLAQKTLEKAKALMKDKPGRTTITLDTMEFTTTGN